MPNNTTLNFGTGGDVIATDELDTLNGEAVSGVKVQQMKVGFGSAGDLRDVDTANPLPIALASANWAAWAPPSTPYDARAFSDVEVQLDGTFTAYTPRRSGTNGTFYPCNATDKDGNPLATITTAGIYRLPGNSWLQLTGGSGATVTIRAGG